MYIWLTIEYGAKNDDKLHKPQYTLIGLLYFSLAFVVGYEIYLHSKHSKHDDHDDKSGENEPLTENKGPKNEPLTEPKGSKKE